MEAQQHTARPGLRRTLGQRHCDRPPPPQRVPAPRPVPALDRLAPVRALEATRCCGALATRALPKGCRGDSAGPARRRPARRHAAWPRGQPPGRRPWRPGVAAGAASVRHRRGARRRRARGRATAAARSGAGRVGRAPATTAPAAATRPPSRHPASARTQPLARSFRKDAGGTAAGVGAPGSPGRGSTRRWQGCIGGSVEGHKAARRECSNTLSGTRPVISEAHHTRKKAG